MGKLIAFLGGIRSGKSAAAEARFRKALGRKAAAYLATIDSKMAAKDKDLLRRVADHQARRPAGWVTLELGRELVGSVGRAVDAGAKAALLDGLGLWIALRMQSSEAEIRFEAASFAQSAKKRLGLTVVVLDEAGQGGVPMHWAARKFADLNGAANQAIALHCDEVWRMDAGIATRIR